MNVFTAASDDGWEAVVALNGIPERGPALPVIGWVTTWDGAIEPVVVSGEGKPWALNRLDHDRYTYEVRRRDPRPVHVVLDGPVDVMTGL